MSKQKRPVRTDIDGLFVRELADDEWDQMHAIISLMESPERADIVMANVQKLPFDDTPSVLK